jgi:uncharacterized membrane protein
MAKHKPPANRNNEQQQPSRQASIVSQHWSGPLPHPNALAQFNQIIPNGADRIMAMVEEEQKHRIQYESRVVEAQIADTRRGHYLA